MTCRSTVECWETTLGIAIDGCCVVSDHMLIPLLSMSVEPLQKLCAEAMVRLAPQAGDWKPFLLLSVFKKLNLS